MSVRCPWTARTLCFGRRYADQATGYSLEFESAIFDQAFLVFTKSNGLDASGSFEVIYDDDRLRSIMQEYVHNAIETVAAIVDPPALRERAEQALNEIASNLLNGASLEASR